MIENNQEIKAITDSSDFLRTLDIVPLEILTRRRGALVALVESKYGKLVLKTSFSDADNIYNPYDAVLHEGQILQALGDTTRDLYVSHGEDNNGHAWLLTRWHGENTAALVAKKLRESGLNNNKNKRTFLSLASQLAAKVSFIHKHGYLHGDLQPNHFLINGENIALVDWAIAHKIKGDSFVYKGAFVHYAAPEVAQQMLNKEPRVQYTESAEIYAMGAVLFFLYTGYPAVDYGKPDFKAVPFSDKLQRVSQNRLLSFQSTNAPPFPELEAALSCCLSKNVRHRFNTMEMLVKTLNQILL